MKVSIMGREIELKNGIVAAIITAAVLTGCLIGYIFFGGSGDIIIEADDAREAPAIASEENMKKEGAKPAGSDVSTAGGSAGNNLEMAKPEEKIMAAEKIKVYVVGCVRKPGIVEIEKGQLIDDAVRLAGGFTDEADAENINLVYPLDENVMLCVKSKRETERSAGPVLQQASRDVEGKEDAGENSAGKSVEIVRDSGAGAVVVGDGRGLNGANDGTNKNAKKVNINTAGIDELDTLPGIGEATARDIIAFREKNGGFRKIEDIMKVPRIKQNRFESIKDFITVY